MYNHGYVDFMKLNYETAPRKPYLMLFMHTLCNIINRSLMAFNIAPTGYGDDIYGLCSGVSYLSRAEAILLANLNIILLSNSRNFSYYTHTFYLFLSRFTIFPYTMPLGTYEEG